MVFFRYSTIVFAYLVQIGALTQIGCGDTPMKIEADHTDPFADNEKSVSENRVNLSSDQFVSDEVLKMLDEPRLDKGSDQSPIIRVTYLRSGQQPVSITLYCGESSTRIVSKSLFARENSRHTAQVELKTIVSELDENKTQLLQLFRERLGDASRYSSAPLKSIGDILDGSIWLYEFVGSESCITIARKTPLEFDKFASLEGVDVFAENRLVNFGLLLWVLSGVPDGDLH